ncbi:sensor histidine kinase [Actinomadura alba]|uniref:histidine kinase n=1 Tax=Actinomadura alba TaxID=406431 RepID=A0ABR7LN11_9ACTN|nr:HAMP domain-containing sensor histidine kinase [Actinomadura alba]MBC6466223.1 HAMP domain-containing histidine kinase [Actinomadura alba]
MRLTIRLRFGLLCGAVVLCVGAALVAALYLLIKGRQRAQFDEAMRQLCCGYVPPHPIAVLQRETLDLLVFWGAITVGAAAAVAVGLGWWTAGWALRPLRRVTETARRVAQSHDLTERIGHAGPPGDGKELADIFDTMLGRLARAFDGQRRFVANASHELRTPLTINRTLVDVAVRRPDATEDVKRLGESLLVVNTRHERLIDGLLALAEGEQTVLDRRPLDLTDVVEHVLDQVVAETEERDVTVHRLLDAAPTAGDAVLLERLVQNLVENAIRHNEKEGEVWVTTRWRADRVELVVANTGLVVPPYEVENIFEPFRRLHGDRLRSERGSGLGLSIVRAIADAHGGGVTAHPRGEGGLTITVELPAE